MSDELNKVAGDIKLAEDWLDECRKAVKAAEQKLFDLRRSQASIKWGVRPGLLVRSRRGELYAVKDIHGMEFGGRPWLIGWKLKKDGTQGRVTATIYDGWEIVP